MYRHKQLLTRDELANKLGLHPTYIYKIEHAQRQLSLGLLLRVAEVLYLKDWRVLLETGENRKGNSQSRPEMDQAQIGPY
jgi:transcriptional regulator with XRE-family HTH domain